LERETQAAVLWRRLNGSDPEAVSTLTDLRSLEDTMNMDRAASRLRGRCEWELVKKLCKPERPALGFARGPETAGVNVKPT
jgi:hypothetical protein